MAEQDQSVSKDAIYADVPHSARIWNYWLGGKDNYTADRGAGDKIMELAPGIVNIARHDRAFLGRAIRFLTGECGIRQFLDIGTGLPTVDNTHEVAQRAAPESKIVYVDNDPLVLNHARALLTSSPEGQCRYIDADLREPKKILREAGKTLDLSKPVAVMMLEIIIHIEDDEDAAHIIRTLMSGVCSGSYLVMTNDTDVIDPKGMKAALALYNENGRPKVVHRHPDQIRRFYDGLELVEPGLVPTPGWRPDAAPFGEQPPEIDSLGGVARKPFS